MDCHSTPYRHTQKQNKTSALIPVKRLFTETRGLSKLAIFFYVLGLFVVSDTLAQDVTPKSLPIIAPQLKPSATIRPVTSSVPLTADIAAKVNDDVITSYDLQQRVWLLIMTSGVQPDEQTLPALRREALRDLIDEHLQMQEIRKIEVKQKLTITPSDKEVDAELTELAKGNNLNLDQLRLQFQKAQVDFNGLRDQVRNQIAWRRYVSGRFGSSVRIGDDQVKAFQERSNSSAAKTQYLVSDIFLDPLRVGGAEVAREGASQLLDQIKKGAPFAAVARQFSAAPSAVNGGDEGWLTSGQIAPELESALQTMQQGDLSQPVVTSDGIYILQLRGKRDRTVSLKINLKRALISLKPDVSSTELEKAQSEILAFKHAVKGCGDFETKASHFKMLSHDETGEVDVKSLKPEVQTTVENLKIGQTTAPIRISSGLSLLMVCDLRQASSQELSRDDVVNRLYADQLNMLARRFLRDLHNSATIETR